MHESTVFAVRRRLKRLLVHTELQATALAAAAGIRPSAAGRGVIFALHHVRPKRPYDFEPNAHLSITPDFLEEAILAARECGLEPIHLADLPSALANGPPSRRFLSFTLDDGYRNNRDHAAPVFRKHGIPYTIFIAPGFAERTRSMWWETAEELIRANTRFDFDFGAGPVTLACATRYEKLVAFKKIVMFFQHGSEDAAIERLNRVAESHGIDPMALVEREAMTVAELKELTADPLASLGAHTMTHPMLARVDADRMKRELVESGARLQDYTGRPTRLFAYPYGGANAVGDREKQAAIDAGFALAVTTRHGVFNASDLDRPTSLPRIALNGNYQQKRYVKAFVSGLAPDAT